MRPRQTMIIFSFCAATACTPPTETPYQGIWLYAEGGTTDIQCPQLDQPYVEAEEPEFVPGNMIRTNSEYKIYSDGVLLEDTKKETVKEAEQTFFAEKDVDENSRLVFRLMEEGYQNVSLITVDIDPEERAILDVPISMTIETKTTYHFTSETKGEISTERTYDCEGLECESLLAEYDLYQRYLLYPTLPCTNSFTIPIEKAYATEEVEAGD